MHTKFRVTGVSVAGPPPILPCSLSLAPGLNVVFGRNGTGKTRFLNEVARTFEAAVHPIQNYPLTRGYGQTDYVEIWGHQGSSGGLTAMLEGGVHLQESLDLDDLSGSPIARAVRRWWESKPWVPATLRNITSGMERQVEAMTELVELGLKPDDVRWFITQGCWMLSRGVLYLCDPDPFGESPLAAEWKKSQQWWDSFEERFANHDEIVWAPSNGRVLYEDNDFLGRPQKWRLHCEGSIQDGVGSPYAAHLALLRVGLNFDSRADYSGARNQADAYEQEYWYSQQIQADAPLLPPVDGWMSRCESRLPTPILGIGHLGGNLAANVSMVDASVRFELAEIGRELAEQLDFVAWDERDASRKLADSAAMREVIERQNPRYQGSEPEPSPVLDVALAEITSSANETLADMFDPNPIISLTRNADRPWNSDHPPILMTANTSRDGGDFGLDKLGAGHQRWVRLAIGQATSAYRSSAKCNQRIDTLSVNVVDEPELALHDSALARIIDYLRRVGTPAVVATHSSELIAQADMSGTLHEITLDERGFTKINEARPDPTGDETEASRWGMSLSRLRSLIRTLVVVEGPQDEAIIEELLADDLRSSAAAIIPMYGSKEQDAVALVKSHCEQIFATSDINLVVVLDNSSRHVLAATIQQVSHLPAQQQKLGFLQGQRSLPEFRRSPEMSTYLALLTAAIRNGKLERLHLCGFEGRDIANLLPISLIAPRYTSWKAAETDFLASVGREHWRSGDGRNFKDFVNRGGGRYTTPGLRKAAQHLVKEKSTLPADVQSLRELLRTF